MQNAMLTVGVEYNNVFRLQCLGLPVKIQWHIFAEFFSIAVTVIIRNMSNFLSVLFIIMQKITHM